MAEFFGDTFKPQGSGSVTVAGRAGYEAQIARVSGWFTGTGPQTGTLRLKENSTVVWEAAVSGGFNFVFPGYWHVAAGKSITLELTGGFVHLIGGFST